MSDTWAASAPPDNESDSAGGADPVPVDQGALVASKAIQRRTGKTFHLATRLFPPAVRHATYVLYGFVRIADEIVDGATETDPAAQRAAIERLRAVAIDGEPTDDPVLEAFQAVKANHGIHDTDVAAFLDAMAADVDGAGARYRTADELDGYVHGSAAAVGHMMTAVMGVEADAARPHAASLGAAFQLTNFLRDVREDRVELNRIYLPERALQRHGASHGAIERLAFDERVGAAIEDELNRAEAHYRHGVAGIRYLPDCCQFPVLAAAVLYAEYHRRIRARGFDVVSARPTIGPVRKLAALARVWYHWRRTRDPEAAFYAASAVARLPDEPERGRVDPIRSTIGRGRLPTPHGGNHGD